MTISSPVKLEGVTKSFGEIHAVKELDLEVQKGERLVILGHNGSGKSTLMRIMATALTPDKGQVSILGRNSHEGLSEVRGSIGAVFDHSSHWEKLSGLENAAFFAGCYGLKKGSFEDRLQDLFLWMDLWKDRNRAVRSYSFGMRRKLAIIEALVHGPDLLLLDEPSMGLDHAARLEFYHLLERESMRGTTVILSTNDVHEAAAVGQRVGVMDRGSLLKTGSPSDLLRDKEGTATIEIRLLSPSRLDFSGIEGVLESLQTDWGWRILVKSSGAESPPCLSTIIERTVSGGGMVSRLDVKWPDLGDLLPKGGT